VPEVNHSVLVEFTPGQMFSLVDTVEDYPKFLPWCGGATVIHRDADTTRATILINYRGIRRSFTTENMKSEPVAMQIRLIEGPFSKLDGSWRFTDLAGHGC
jgi:ribosome-associated toxin RatA of RatAB toxin-antitoxin module